MVNPANVTTLVNAYNQQSTPGRRGFSLLDWFYAGPGAATPRGSQGVAPLADWLGVDWHLMASISWKTRSTTDLAALDDMARGENMMANYNALKTAIIVARLEGRTSPRRL